MSCEPGYVAVVIVSDVCQKCESSGIVVVGFCVYSLFACYVALLI